MLHLENPPQDALLGVVFRLCGGLSGRAYPSLPQQRGVPAVLKISSRIFFRLHGMKKDYRAS
ncbi:hypothetical protein AGRO_1910 [Agrobacterium sp. ATCC 31749]|jgi:hypothetical protein|nr:hypothetical protein AGRO_1910 [Agrobacterium sp. ATCC 31749]